ncbi:NAD synthetase, partial [candidate division GN15 bacterium]|nr:NAD synthetase [candidate division GN15 bacterium]
MLSLVNLAYLVAAVFFILGLKGLTHPRTAVRGNILGSFGMFIAVVVTLLDQRIVSYEMILIGVVIGAGIGAILAVKIEMTAMPQLVALYNGFGGVASVLVASAALLEALGGHVGTSIDTQFAVATVATGIIGAVTFWGSLVAFGKLQGLIGDAAVLFAGQKYLNALLALAAIALAVLVGFDPSQTTMFWIMIGIASVLGITLVIPIGGADMPVVIALLNSYSGLAAAATGFVLDNNVLIIAGSLVGASGLILTNIMCKAMNRSLTNVLFGVLGPSAEGASADDVYAGKVKATSAEEVAMLFDGAQRAIIVPGYGMAVAQAQHAVRELAELL